MCRNRFLGDYSGHSKCALGEEAKWNAWADLVGLRDVAGSSILGCFPCSCVGVGHECVDSRPSDSVSRRVAYFVDVFHAQSAKSRIDTAFAAFSERAHDLVSPG
jgi:hypothetical protein